MKGWKPLVIVQAILIGLAWLEYYQILTKNWNWPTHPDFTPVSSQYAALNTVEVLIIVWAVFSLVMTFHKRFEKPQYQERVLETKHE